jgi:hypothetical protein
MKYQKNFGFFLIHNNEIDRELLSNNPVYQFPYLFL